MEFKETDVLSWMEVKKDENGQYYASGSIPAPMVELIDNHKTHTIGAKVKIDGELTTIVSLSIVPNRKYEPMGIIKDYHIAKR